MVILPAKRCDLCSQADNPVKRVMLYVEGQAMNEHHLCRGCLSRVFDFLQGR